MSDTDTEEIEVYIEKESEKAYLFEKIGHDVAQSPEWFPKSEVSFSRRNVKTHRATAIIPIWLLETKGW